MQFVKKLIFDSLSPIYDKEETESMTRLIIEKVLGFTRLQSYLNQNETISATKLAQIKEIVNRLVQYEPIQYVLGETEFYDLRFRVNQSVLIPRPETEELVEWIIIDNKNEQAAILDIGTGSGCIAITLQKHLPVAYVEGWDISTEALMVAQENAEMNKVGITFRLIDVLNPSTIENKHDFDIIVSNPPYVTESDKRLMQKNVLEFEPEGALFVTNANPLIFYNTIGDLALSRLKPGGFLYFEINENFGVDVLSLLEQKGFVQTKLKKDLHGKDRMLKALKPFSPDNSPIY